MESKQKIFNFDNTYIDLSKNFYQETKPIPVKKPKLLFFNNVLSSFLNLDKKLLQSQLGTFILSGNVVPEGAKPIAMVYAGHQFGNFVELGDGRAILLGEIISKNGLRFDIQLKGSGKTAFSRQGDGRAPLESVLREYVISEAMHNLGIPTTRSLSVVETGEVVQRELEEPSGILTRVSSSHIRIGTFEFFSAKNDTKSLKELANYAIKRHFPKFLKKKNKYELFLDKVIFDQAKLVSQWMNSGFIHGVMNTDNITISGETIDYGPCAFMNDYNPAKVYSYIDFKGRYSYGNQPQIMFWNLSRFASSIKSLFDEKKITSEDQIIKCLRKFPKLFEKFWYEGITKKLGLSGPKSGDELIIKLLLELMFENKTDFTQTFRLLSEVFDKKGYQNFQSLFQNKEKIDHWYKMWEKRIFDEKKDLNEICKKMKSVNPIYIPRNHIVEDAIKKFIHYKDYSELNMLIKLLKNPFTERKKMSYFSLPPKPGDDIKNTFCGT